MSIYTPRVYAAPDRDTCIAVFESNVPEYFTVEERADFTSFLDALPGPYLVVEDAMSTVVACGGHATGETPERADLCWGMVRRDLHGHGIGRLLTEARVQAAFSEPTVRVVALNTSQRTVDFYRRMGFRLESVVPNGYAPGLDRCEMRLRREERIRSG